MYNTEVIIRRIYAIYKQQRTALLNLRREGKQQLISSTVNGHVSKMLGRNIFKRNQCWCVVGHWTELADVPFFKSNRGIPYIASGILKQI